MRQYLGLIAILVHDYDEALGYYAGTLGFECVEDQELGGGKRWVVVSPPGSRETKLLLARVATAEQAGEVGAQGGGRVWLFLYSDDFWRDYRKFRAKGVDFLEEPREEPYGTVAVFRDLYGNKWDLLQPA